MTDPRIAALPEWLRLHGTTNPDTDPAEAEWCSMLLAAANEIDRLRARIAELEDQEQDAALDRAFEDRG